VRWLDLYEREPRSLVVGAFLWGATVAVTFASFSNVSWGEAITKLFGAESRPSGRRHSPRPSSRRATRSSASSCSTSSRATSSTTSWMGFVFGAMVGLGFTVIEDIDYFISVFGGSHRRGARRLLGARRRVGAVRPRAVHGTRRDRRRVLRHAPRRGAVRRRLAVALGLFVLAVVAHFFWNSPWLWELPLFLATALKGMPFFIVLFVALRLARRREHRWLGSALEGEVGRGGAVRRSSRC
jgi:RsiW-degrading membrane proteinase PrsW (M82 family)